MGSTLAHASEREREDLVCTLACPVDGCGAGPGEACVLPDWAKEPKAKIRGRNTWAYAHTGRYDRAAAAGLVPAMVGAHG